MKLFTNNLFNDKKRVYKSDLFKSKLSNNDCYTDKNCHWVPLSMSSIAKNSDKHIITDKEFLDSYLQAFDILCNSSLNKIHPFSGFACICKSSPVLPCLFCGRHIIELSIKMLIYKCDNDWKPDGHSLKDLWNIFSTKYPKEQRGKHEERIFTNMKSFIDILDEYDSKGFNFRYGFAKDGKTLLISDWSFVDLKKLNYLIHDFVKQVLAFE